MEQMSNHTDYCEALKKALILKAVRHNHKLSLEDNIFIINTIYKLELKTSDFDYEVDFMIRKDHFMTQLFEKIDKYCLDKQVTTEEIRQLIPVFWKAVRSEIYGYFNDLYKDGIIV